MILVVDDDASVLHSLGLLLKQAGYATLTASSPADALERAARPDVELVLQDMNFSRRTTGEEGLELLARLRALRPDVPVVLITAWGSIALAVAGMRAGAADFITKPWTHEQLLHAVRTALELAARGGAQQPGALRSREELDAAYDFSGIVGRDPRLLQLLEVAGRVSRTDASVLITGESGTGKELVAEAIHRNSERAAGPFVRVNLGGIPAGLFESEMFGHRRGAFTDAKHDRAGRFALASGGTIFLDEIGDLDPSCQVKLLRVLQDRAIEPLGSSSAPVVVDVRVISATNRDLKAAVESGRFREDLLYRLNLIALHMPPLRDRGEDIPLLAQHFLQRAAAAYERPGMQLATDALQWLRAHPLPGNSRQLRHLVERAMLVSDTPLITAGDLQLAQGMESPESGEAAVVANGTLEDVERAMIARHLGIHAGNVTKVAEALGLSRAALYRRLDKYGLRP